MRLLTLLAVGTLITTVTAQIAQPIVERKEYYAGDTFNITCDITKFSGPLSTSPYIFTMSLMRQTLTETKLQTLTETKFSTLAIYQPFAAPNEHNITTLPSGKQWIVQYSGGDGYTNRQTMKIVTTVVGLRCDDAGLYKCALTFPGSLTPIDSNVVNLTTKAQISQDDMIVTPRNGDNPYSSYYNLGENENTTITLTCNFQGPTDLTAVWKFSKDSNEPDYLPLNGIVNETPVTTSAGCTSSSYKSILTFQLQADHGETTYFCTVVENNVEMSRANFTIGISQTTEAPSTGGQTASGSVNVGAIVGGVIGGVVFLIIVIVLIYFFVIRRKRQGGGEEKRKDLETTDSGKDNNFTPPPVFYSKPHKPPKDERDGSRGDSSLGHTPYNGVSYAEEDQQGWKNLGKNNPTFTGDIHYASVDVSGSEDSPPPRPKRKHEIQATNDQLHYLELDVPKNPKARKPRNVEPVEYSEIQV